MTDGDKATEHGMTVRRKAATDLENLLTKIRALGGEWEWFFPPPLVSTMKSRGYCPLLTSFIID